MIKLIGFRDLQGVAGIVELSKNLTKENQELFGVNEVESQYIDSFGGPLITRGDIKKYINKTYFSVMTGKEKYDYDKWDEMTQLQDFLRKYKDDVNYFFILK